MQCTSLGLRDTNDVYNVRRVGDSLAACVTSGGAAVSVIKRVSAVQSDNNDQDIDPSDLLDHWLRELDSAKMVSANWIFKLVNFHSVSPSRI